MPRQSNLPIIIDSFVGFGKEGQGKQRLKKFLHFCTQYVRGCGLDILVPKKAIILPLETVNMVHR
jgi:hypothetical protein